MARWHSLTVVWGMLSLALLAGCGKSESDPEARPAGDGNDPKAVPAQPASRPNDARHQAFAQAATLQPPRDAHRPPDLTSTGKHVGKLFERIAGKDGLWDQIAFVDASGRKLHYAATLRTELGDITIELWPELAPNHVRNFLALSKAGYYEGTTFHQAIRQAYDDETGAKQVFQYLEAGCPLGTGDPGYGSIGYWLKPELHDPQKQPKAVHGEGTIGAWRYADDPDSAACKFYMTLSKAPWMDGDFTVFGKITAGLEVARQILARPSLPEDPTRPRQPVVIRQVVVRTSAADFPQ